MKLLVVTADDLGYSEERNNGIEECFRRGIVTHSSLMVNGVAAEHGAKLYKDHGYSLGLHFNISEGVPIAEATRSSSLVNDDGMFLGMKKFWEDVKCGKLNRKDVRVEFSAQLEKFKSLIGHYPGHVDGHQHVHIAPGVCEEFADVMKEFKITSTRLPLDVSMETEMRPTRFTEFLDYVVKQSKNVQEIFQDRGIRTSDSYFGLATMGSDMNIDKVKAGLLHTFSSVNSKVNNSICEFMVHPGYRTGDIGGCGIGPDEFSQSEDREHEMKVLSDADITDFYSQQDIKLVPWVQCWSS